MISKPKQNAIVQEKGQQGNKHDASIRFPCGQRSPDRTKSHVNKHRLYLLNAIILLLSKRLLYYFRKCQLRLLCFISLKWIDSRGAFSVGVDWETGSKIFLSLGQHGEVKEIVLFSKQQSGVQTLQMLFYP